jgi:hypothetical protein
MAHLRANVLLCMEGLAILCRRAEGNDRQVSQFELIVHAPSIECLVAEKVARLRIDTSIPHFAHTAMPSGLERQLRIAVNECSSALLTLSKLFSRHACLCQLCT